MDIIGKKIGRYDIQAHIGEGGMAHVYSAFDPEINRTVAAKILKEEHSRDDERMRRFIKEGRAAGALTHPNIVTVYDVGEVDGAPYIMMELLEGQTLGNLLQDNVRLPMQTIIEIAIQLANALDYAHTKGVVHRDMKPDNIVLSSDYKSLKIADFGIARVDTLSDNENTQVGMMLGTPRYMSPEQASGTRVDGRSDLFAVGVILYELITGKKAFDADSMPTLIMQIVQKDPMPIRQLTNEAPAGLEKIVTKLLQKKPIRRFSTGNELREALERELQALREEEEESSGYLPLQVKWTAIMTALVALVMTVSSFFIFRAQSNVLTQQAIDAGISLSKFVAVQAAIPVLGEDWVTLDSFVMDAARRQSFSYLVVADHTGVVRAASDPSLLGKNWEPSKEAPLVYSQDRINVTRVSEAFNFEVPVLFNDTVVGGLNMGMDTRQLQAALDTTQRMMAIFVLAVILAVAVAVFVFNKLITKNILLATRALHLLGQGQMETRISKTSVDEFGDMFAAFNSMADALEPATHSTSPTTEKEQPHVASSLDATAIDSSGIRQTAEDEVTAIMTQDTDNDAK